jgi:hypothetical protein
MRWQRRADHATERTDIGRHRHAGAQEGRACGGVVYAVQRVGTSPSPVLSHADIYLTENISPDRSLTGLATGVPPRQSATVTLSTNG